MNRYHYHYLAILTGIVASPLVFQQTLAQTPPNWYQDARKSVVLIQTASGVRQGTGFIVNRENNTYYVLTAKHVVENGQFRIITDSGDIFSVDKVTLLPGVDLALLQFTSSNPIPYPTLRPVTDNRQIQVLSRIFILGYPTGGPGNLEVSPGNITSITSPSPDSISAFFYNVETQPGMSGSPVLNENAEVIGVHTGRLGSGSFRDAVPIGRYRELAPLVFTQAARDNLGAGNFDQAIASLEQVRGLFGQDNPEVAMIRAYAFFGKGELDRAKNEVRQLGSSNANAALLLGTIDYLQGNFSSAISNLSRANELDSRNLGGYALAIRGLSYAENPSSFGDAIQSANNAIGLLSSDSFVYFARSCVRTKTGDTVGANTDLVNANSPERQRTPQNVFLAVLNPKLQGSLRRCLPLGNVPIPIPTPPPRQSARYKSSPPINLSQGISALVVSRDNRLAAVGLRDGNVLLYNLQSRSVVATLNSGQDTAISSVAFSPDNRSIAFAATNGEVKVFDVQSRAQRYRLDAGGFPIVIFNSNSRFLFVGSDSGTLRIVNNNGATIASEATTHLRGINSLALSPDGSLLASGGGDGLVKLWSTSDLTPVDSYQAHQGIVQSLAFSADGTQIISAGFDDLVKSCNWRTKQCAQLERSPGVIRSLAVAPTLNGHIAYSVDNRIFLQNQRNIESLGTLLDHTDTVDALAYTTDGRFLISGSRDNTLIIWEVQ